MTPININNANAIPVTTGKLLSLEEFPKDVQDSLMRGLPTLMTPEERQAQVDYQNSIPQTTVIENNGEILAVFGDNGWKRTFSNSDVFGHDLSEIEIINAFKRKYGSSLTVNRYSQEDAPTMGEIHEKKYGRPLTPKVNYFA